MLDLESTLLPAEPREDSEEPSEYALVKYFASGSYGKVFLVVHKAEGKQYVMKEIPSFYEMEMQQQEAMTQEVDLLRNSLHPNIVAYRDAYINQGGHLCIFMEFCEHGDVHNYYQQLKRSGKALPSEAQTLEWLVQISLALHSLHQSKILHRDLKTQNVFLAGKPRGQHQGYALKLGDLGIARVLTSTGDLATTQIGTPYSMSPEVFNSKAYGYESDIWGLGCVFYELVNGTNAFEAQSINGLALKVLRGQFTPVTSRVSKDTEQLIKSMLHTNVKKRLKLPSLFGIPIVRKQVVAAVRAASLAYSTAAERSWAEEALNTQLQSISDEAFDVPGTSNDSHSNNHQKQIERAERRKRREEETLKRLQHTAEVLNDYLWDVDEGAPTQSAHQTKSASQAAVGRGMTNVLSHGYANCSATMSHNSSGSGYGRGYGCHAPPRAPLAMAGSATVAAQPLPQIPLPHAQRDRWGGGGTPTASSHPNDGGLSHRDRVLRRKEQRREEESLKFEQEARKIRQENLAYQRAWVQGSRPPVDAGARPWKSERPSTSERTLPVPSTSAGPSQGAMQGRRQNGSDLQPLIDYGNLTAEHMANPFKSYRPAVVNTPRRRFLSSESLLGDANVSTPRVKIRNSSGSTADEMVAPAPSRPPPGRHQQSQTNGGMPPSFHGVAFRMLPQETRDNARSDASERSHSCSEISENGLGCSGNELNNDQLKSQAQEVQRRINRCLAQIEKHRCTLESLREASDAPHPPRPEYRDVSAPTSPRGRRLLPRGSADLAHAVADALASSRSPNRPQRRLAPDPLKYSSQPSMSVQANGLNQPSLSTYVTPAPQPAHQPFLRQVVPQPQPQPPPQALTTPLPSMPPFMQDRIARLRRCCLEALGQSKFEAVQLILHHCLKEDQPPGSIRSRMKDALGSEHIGFYSMIDQIHHIEQRWGPPDAQQQWKSVMGSDNEIQFLSHKSQYQRQFRSRSPS